MTPQGKKVLGIVAEYNPFHNGHQYHIEEAKRISGCDHVIVIMSGDFVQRGAPALLDKYTRARFALEAGVDAVLELPVACACGSAEFFARGAVGILHALGIVDSLCFGCEDTDLTSLQQLADILLVEPADYQETLAGLLRSGMNFPAARQEALASMLGPETAALLATPNNILAVEYLKALKYLGSSIQPLAIRRIGSYHDTDLSGSCFASATAIRELVRQTPLQLTQLASLLSQVPDFVFSQLNDSGFHPVWADDFSGMLYFALMQLTSQPNARDQLTGYQDISPELADRILDGMHDSFSITDLSVALLSKGYTGTRINRALMHILLDITTGDMEQLKALSYAPYARILGLKKESSSILRSVSEDNRIPLITKIADAKTLLSPEALHFLDQDIHAAEMYNQVVYNRYQSKIPSDYFYRFPVI